MLLFEILIIVVFIIIIYIVAKSKIKIKKTVLKFLNFISIIFFCTDIPDFEDDEKDNTK